MECLIQNAIEQPIEKLFRKLQEIEKKIDSLNKKMDKVEHEVLVINMKISNKPLNSDSYISRMEDID